MGEKFHFGPQVKVVVCHSREIEAVRTNREAEVDTSTLVQGSFLHPAQSGIPTPGNNPTHNHISQHRQSEPHWQGQGIVSQVTQIGNPHRDPHKNVEHKHGHLDVGKASS